MLRYHPDKLRGGHGGPLSDVARGREGALVSEAYGVLKAALEGQGEWEGGDDDGARIVREVSHVFVREPVLHGTAARRCSKP